MSAPGDFAACAVCGRNLLRGEEVETFLHDGKTQRVCELCVPRALHAGWIRVGPGDTPTLLPHRRSGIRGALSAIGRKLGRPAPQERQRREPARPAHAEATPREPGRPAPRRIHRIEDEVAGLALQVEEPPAPLAQRGTTAGGHRAEVATAGVRMAARAVDVFNHSPHPRTLAGIGRSLGSPWVTVRTVQGAHVRIVIAWELTWYRFDIDLTREEDGAAASGRGTSLDELDPGDVDPNAVADEHGYLYLQTASAA